MAKTKSSISDSIEYTKKCLDFVNDDLEFSKFKQNAIYTNILEHASVEQALACIESIKKSGLDLNKIDILKSNDEQGSPTIAYYGNPVFDGISPSTIRYIKALGDLIDTFKSLDGYNIIEIGVGYGGQCKLINDYFNIESYQLVDLDEVLKLSEKYLSKYNYKNNLFDNTNFKDTYDLVISNYAITECSKNIQSDYITNILNKSKHGFITCNYISHIFNIESMTKSEFIESINKKVHIIEEYPLTYEGNCILVW